MAGGVSAQPVPGADTRLRGTWLLLARVGWIVFTSTVVGLDIVGIPVFRTQVLMPCASSSPDCLNAQLSVDALRSLRMMGVSLNAVGWYLTALTCALTFVYVLVGAIIFWRRSDDRMAFFASFALVAFGGAAVAGTMQALPAANPLWSAPIIALDALGQVCFYACFLLFPDGRFVPRWTRWLALLYAAGWMTAFFPGSLPDAIGSSVRNGATFLVFVLSLVAAQAYRYWRVSNMRQRQQTKWVVYGITLGLTVFCLILILSRVLPVHIVSNGVGTLIANSVIDVIFMLIPITIAIAMQRSRLYDVDVLINRTLVYGSLTAVLAIVYFGGVYGAQALLSALVPAQAVRQSPVLIVASTLLVASLFTPLRRGIQITIDRRFYRRKYNAAKTLARFSATLRSDVDLADLKAHLVSVVDETMQPAHVSLWLRELVPRGDRRDHAARALERGGTA